MLAHTCMTDENGSKVDKFYLDLQGTGTLSFNTSAKGKTPQDRTKLTKITEFCKNRYSPSLLF